MSKKLLLILVCAALAVSFGYIYLSPGNKTIQDEALFKWVSSEKDYTFYKNNDAVLPTSEETDRAHDNFMRVKLNKIAASVLNSEGKLPEGKVFPDSSIIVKEIYSEKNSKPEILAVMVKLKGAENSAKDWLWAEYSPGGDVEYSVSKKGKVCTGCHKPGDDYVRILDILK